LIQSISAWILPGFRGVLGLPSTKEIQMRAVRFDRYGGIDVLDVVDVEPPLPGAGEVLVRVKAVGINPGEASIREGLMHERWPATFPSGQGSDLAGVVAEVGSGVEGLAVGDEVIGFTHDRASQAELVVVEAQNLTARPSTVPWEAAGSLFVVGTTAYAAVRAVSPSDGDVLAISGAAGGVGTVAVQLARNAGATVIALAGERHHDWLRGHGAIPVTYGVGVARRIRDAAGGRPDAFIDTFGSGYVDLAIDLGVPPQRIDTIIDWDAANRLGVKTDGNSAAASADTLAELARLIAEGRLEIPIARVYPLAEVREAYRELERRHTLGKIVLRP
jgi:NADPH:quinone reductase-like Zn-dependent oxidoreductase